MITIGISLTICNSNLVESTLDRWILQFFFKRRHAFGLYSIAFIIFITNVLKWDTMVLFSLVNPVRQPRGKLSLDRECYRLKKWQGVWVSGASQRLFRNPLSTRLTLSINIESVISRDLSHRASMRSTSSASISDIAKTWHLPASYFAKRLSLSNEEKTACKSILLLWQILTNSQIILTGSCLHQRRQNRQFGGQSSVP